MGRPVRYGGEYGGFSERLSYMAEIAAEGLAEDVIEDSDTARRVIKRVPWGVVLVVAPWNYPYMTAINTVAPALIAGNSVILKHASQTLQVGEHLAEALHAAGVPKDVFPERGHRPRHDRRPDRGPPRDCELHRLGRGRAGDGTGRRGDVHAGLDPNLVARTPGYVRADADLDAAVDGLMDGAMFNAGQCCCGSSGFTSPNPCSMPLSKRPSPGSRRRSWVTRLRPRRRLARWPMSALPGSPRTDCRGAGGRGHRPYRPDAGG